MKAVSQNAVSRRDLIKGAASLAGAGLTQSAFGQTAMAQTDDRPPIGSWTALADLPFATQEIYPAPFWRRQSIERPLKPAPYNILINAGGFSPSAPSQVTDQTIFYDPLTNEWGNGTSLPQARHHIALVNHNGFIFAVGGFSADERGGWQSQTDVWRLDSLNGTWIPMAPLPSPQSETVCVSLAGYIHIVSGRSPSGSRNFEWRDHIDTSNHWAFDAHHNHWEPVAPIPTARNSAASAIVDNTLYVMGGRTVYGPNTNVVDAYDAFSDRWTRVAPMPKAHAGHAAGVINGKIYAFGGEVFEPRPGAVFAECWEYDPREDKWRAVAAMPRRRHGLGAVSLNNSIYVLGGASEVSANGTSNALDRFDI